MGLDAGLEARKQTFSYIWIIVKNNLGQMDQLKTQTVISLPLSQFLKPFWT